MTDNSLKEKLEPGKLILTLIVCLIVGTLLSLWIHQPILGVIHFSSEIYNVTARELITQIRHAYDNPQIKAVVMVMDSPGGTVTDTEAVYMELNRLREKKPVVMMVQGMAASGGYYLASAADYIISEPSSLIGNIGVLRYTPSYPNVTEDVYSTGPYKLWGGPGETFIREMELMKTGFLQAIKLGRGERLRIDDAMILRGQIWPGSEALRFGLVDELGSLSRALQKASELALIKHYATQDLRGLSGLPDEPQNNYYLYQEDEESDAATYAKREGFYYLYPGSQEVH